MVVIGGEFRQCTGGAPRQRCRVRGRLLEAVASFQGAEAIWRTSSSGCGSARAETLREYAEWLLDMGDGKLQTFMREGEAPHESDNAVRLLEGMALPNDATVRLASCATCVPRRV